MIKISPSLLAADFTALGDDIRRVTDAGAEYLHIDVMDGHFVPNMGFGLGAISSIRRATDSVLDVHLMIEKPERYIEEFAKAGADIITIHYESTADPAAVLKKITELGVRASISIKPGTPVESIHHLLPLVSMVLVMTVEPGFGGQSLIPATLDKVAALSDEIARQGLDVEIEVDGGVTPENVTELISRGAGVIVAGSAIFKAKDIPAAVAAMRK